MSGKKVGVIGSGQVAKVLSAGFVRYGYDVMAASRDIVKLKEWKSKAGLNIGIGSAEEVAAFADTIVLAVKGTAAEPVIRSVVSKIRGKTIIDTTNPIAE